MMPPRLRQFGTSVRGDWKTDAHRRVVLTQPHPCVKISGMSRTARTHENGADLMLLQVRISPATREAVIRAADKTKVSWSYYVDQLISRHLLEDGELPEIPNPKAQRGQELPIDTAA